jgi:hypothetical protein
MAANGTICKCKINVDEKSNLGNPSIQFLRYTGISDQQKGTRLKANYPSKGSIGQTTFVRAPLVGLPAPDSPRESEEPYQTGVFRNGFWPGSPIRIPHFTKGSENPKKLAPRAA